MSENFSSVTTADDLPPFSSVITADDLMPCLLSVRYGKRRITGINFPTIASVEEIASVLNKVNDDLCPWDFDLSDGKSGLAAVTVLTMPYNNDYLYVYVRICLDGDNEWSSAYCVRIDNRGDELLFTKMKMPLNWHSPTIRLYDGDYDWSRRNKKEPSYRCFMDLSENCTKKKKWFISSEEEIAQQIDYFTLDYRFPNDCMLLFTHSRYVRSDMLVIPWKNGLKSSGVEIRCRLDDQDDFGFHTNITVNPNSRVVCIPVDLKHRVDVDQLCAAERILFICDDLGIKATFSTSGLAECILSANRAIPLLWLIEPFG